MKYNTAIATVIGLLLFLLPVLLIVLLFGAQSTHAQNDVVADVAFINAATQENTPSVWSVSFEIVNRDEGILLGVRYGVLAVEESNGVSTNVLETYVFDELLALPNNIPVARKIQFDASHLFSENKTIKLYLFARSSSGAVPLASRKIAEYKPSSPQDSIVVIPSTCLSEVVGQIGKQYKLDETIFIDEINGSYPDIHVVCNAASSYSKSRTFLPHVMTYQRSEAGPLIEKKSGSSVAFSANELKEIAIDIKTQDMAQRYVSVISFEDGGKTSSNKIAVKYALTGSAASIELLSLDKDLYEEGDVAKTSLRWSPLVISAPQGIQESRPDVSLEISISDGDGKVCSQEVSRSLNGQAGGLVETSFQIIRTCNDPIAVARLLDSSGNTLFFGSYATGDAGKLSFQFSTKTMIIFGGVIILLLLAYFVVRVTKGKDEYETTN